MISWAGGEIEPYGVDYILQRLGFSHARTTIPKWLQRGCMDPLDKVLSVIVLKTIQLVQEEKTQQQQSGVNNQEAAAPSALSRDVIREEEQEQVAGIVIDIGGKRLQRHEAK